MSTEAPITLPAPGSGPVSPTPDEVAVAIRLAWANFVKADSRPMTKRQNVYASSYRECDRRMVLDMTEGDQLKPFSPETLAKFRRGNDRERDLMADLKRIGRNCDPSFEVIGEQERFELRDRKGRVAITGKVDGKLKMSVPIRGIQEIAVETKAWHPLLTAKVDKFEDLFNNRWTKSGAYQLLSYLYGLNLPVGFMLLDKSGIPTLLPVELYENLDRMEKFLLKAERVMDHKEAGTLPDYTKDPEECKICDFYGSVCIPEIRSGPGAMIETDPEIIQDLERYVELQNKLDEAGLEEFEGLDKWAKKQFRGVEQGIAGNILITGKWQKQTKYEMPADVEKRIKDEMAQYAKTEPKGKFFLTVTKVV